MPTPEATIELLKQAEQLNEAEKYNEVIAFLTDELLEAHNSAELCTERASAHQRLKQSDVQIKYLEKAFGINDNYYKAYNSRGIAWAEKNEFNKAIEDLNKAIALKPDYAPAYYNRGATWASKKEYTKAIENYNKAIQLNPDYVFAYNNRGNARHDLNEYNEAIEDYNQVIKLKPDYALAYFNRGLAWFYKSEYDKAIEDYGQAIALKSDFASAYNNRGFTWFNKDETDKAVEDYHKAIELKPDLANPHYSLYLYHLINNITLARCYLNRANFLDYRKIADLIRAYHQDFISPFMLQRVLLKLGKPGSIKVFVDVVYENERQCRNWLLYLSLITSRNFSTEEPIITKRTKSLINYFMGDCIESFRIYAKESYTGKSMLSLRDFYYYIKSAQDFLEPYENILQCAEVQAEKDARRSVENRYYAGMLCLLNNETEKAEIYFTEAASFGFRPALYQLSALYDHILYDPPKRNEICEKLKQLEEENTDRYGLINGMAPLIVNTQTDLIKDVYDFCKYYAFYAENIEEIQLVRNFLHLEYPYKRYEFWELVDYEDEAIESFKAEISLWELTVFEKYLHECFAKACIAAGKEQLHKRIFNSSEASQAFTDLKKIAEEENIGFEKSLALRIKDMARQKVRGKWFLVFAKILHLQGKLTISEAVALHLYAEHIAIKSEDESMLEEINIEIQDWLDNIVIIATPFLIKLILKAFAFIQDGFEMKKPQDNDYEDYLQFKADFYNHLEFWKNNLIKTIIEKNK